MQTYIKTYGCTLNHADSDIMASLLNDAGVAMAPSEELADTVIVNTCTVKKQTEQKILYLLGRLASEGKNIIATGCMASANKDLIARYAPKAVIVSPSNTDRIAEAVDCIKRGDGTAPALDGYKRLDKAAMVRPNGSIVARIPVSEGCLSNCTFCETKLARGPLNSFPEDTIIKAIEYSVSKSSKEIEITSQDMGAYGLDRKTDIAELMKRIAGISGDFKVRIGMLNPEHLHRYIYELIEAMQSDKFYKFIHIPIQSGSGKVLSDMRRMCTAESFIEYVKELRRGVEGISIETDIIVGYPTETEDDFKMTMDLIREVKPDVTNISRFSARPNTKAEKLKQLDYNTVNARSAELSRMVRSVQRSINSKYLGKTARVLLTESNSKSINGKTDTYKQVVLPNASGISLGSTVSAGIYAVSANALYGSIMGV